MFVKVTDTNEQVILLNLTLIAYAIQGEEYLSVKMVNDSEFIFDSLNGNRILAEIRKLIARPSPPMRESDDEP